MWLKSLFVGRLQIDMVRADQKGSVSPWKNKVANSSDFSFVKLLHLLDIDDIAVEIFNQATRGEQIHPTYTNQSCKIVLISRIIGKEGRISRE